MITNDGATILKQMDVQHPAAKMVCALSLELDAFASLSLLVLVCGVLYVRACV